MSGEQGEEAGMSRKSSADQCWLLNSRHDGLHLGFRVVGLVDQHYTMEPIQ